MNRELDIIIEIGLLQHMCEIYQQDRRDDIWEVIMASVCYLNYLLTTVT